MRSVGALKRLALGALFAAVVVVLSAPSFGAQYASTYTPTSIAGCVLWLDAADTSTITTATGVSQWNDKCSTNNVAQATGANQPTETTVNGRNALVFNGTSQYLTKASSTLPSGTSPDFTAFLAVTYAADATNHVALWWGATAGTAQVDLGQSNNTTAYFYNGSVSWTPAVTGYSTPEILEWQSASATVSAWQNGAALSPTGGGTSTVAASPALFIGVFGNTTQQWWKSQILEIIVYNVALSTANRQVVEGYLCYKWGLSGNCGSVTPYTLTPPYGWLWAYGTLPQAGVYPGGAP
jgi:hypothetical protein